MNNYNCKFKIGERVKIISGLYKDNSGTIKDYNPNVTLGLSQDNARRYINKDFEVGFYVVKLGLFKSIYVQEEALRAI